MIPFAYHLASGDDYAVDLDRLADERPFDPATALRVRIDYPLSFPVVIDVSTGEAGFTRRAFAEAVAAAYRRIYEEEDATCTLDPTPRGFLLNRSRTDGRYGIWGHDLADLVLEGAERGADGAWWLYVGS